MSGTDRKLRSFTAGESVLSRSYNNNKWEEGEVIRQTGPVSYEIKTATRDKTIKRHADQLVSSAANEHCAPGDPPPSSDRPRRQRKAVIKFGDSVYHD